MSTPPFPSPWLAEPRFAVLRLAYMAFAVPRWARFPALALPPSVWTIPFALGLVRTGFATPGPLRRARTTVKRENPALKDVLPKEYARAAMDKERLG